MKHLTLSMLAAALVLAGCSAPEFHQPQINVPVIFKEHQGAIRTAADGSRWRQAQAAEHQARGEWWLAFSDTALTKLIAEASRNNANLAVAAARVKQARAIAGIAEADRAPQVGFAAGVQRARTPVPQTESGTGPLTQTTYSAALTASYEVDLFGRVASSVAAAKGDAAAADATYRSVLLSLQADVAQTYFRLRATDAELDTLADAVRLREESLQLTQRRFDHGDIGEFDLSRARTELSTAKAEAIGLRRQRLNAEHAMAVLLGRPPANFTVSVNPLLDSRLPSIPSGMPSTLLERRPDIAAAQRAMEASNARIGIARAAMFPALTLNASGGSAGDTVSNIFAISGQSWLLGAMLSMPLIDGGRNKANIARSEAVLEESVASYRQSVLLAFAEVEDNLAGLRILDEQSTEVDDAVRSARRSANLAQKLYDAGRSSYIDLLDAQRNLAGVERNAIQLRGSRAVATIALIRSLGGSWDQAKG
jgi:multidrug efflux system outer membrane protein